MELKKFTLILLLGILFLFKSDTSHFTTPRIIRYITNPEVVASESTVFKVQREIINCEVELTLTKNEAIKLGLINGVYAIDKNIISKLKEINNNRFSFKYINRYNKYDNLIEESLKRLEEKGETPDYNLVKAIMLIETGMIPRKNSKGYQGFPQTKWWIVKRINKRYGTDFNMNDMYDPNRSALFIHYYLKNLNSVRYLNNIDDYLASYNWGVGNYKKHLFKNKRMPHETKEYIALIKTILNEINIT